MDNGGSQNLTKLTTANMEDMEEYYNFGKDTSSYATPWAASEQRTRVRLYPDAIMTFEETVEGGGVVVSAEASVWKNCRTLMRGQEGNALHKRHSSSLADTRDTKTLDSAWSSFRWAWWWGGAAALAGSRIQTAQPVCCMYQSLKKSVAVAEAPVTFDVIGMNFIFHWLFVSHNFFFFFFSPGGGGTKRHLYQIHMQPSFHPSAVSSPGTFDQVGQFSWRSL